MGSPPPPRARVVPARTGIQPGMSPPLPPTSGSWDQWAPSWELKTWGWLSQWAQWVLPSSWSSGSTSRYSHKSPSWEHWAPSDETPGWRPPPHEGPPGPGRAPAPRPSPPPHGPGSPSQGRTPSVQMFRNACYLGMPPPEAARSHGSYADHSHGSYTTIPTPINLLGTTLPTPCGSQWELYTPRGILRFDDSHSEGIE